MQELGKWLELNQLKLDAQKTNVVGLKSRGRNVIKPTVTAGGFLLKVTEQAPFLGVILDHTLNWKGHIQLLRFKLAN